MASPMIWLGANRDREREKTAKFPVGQLVMYSPGTLV
jgi:hypothetical protein